MGLGPSLSLCAEQVPPSLLPSPIIKVMQLSYEQFIGALCIWREARGCTTDCWTGIWHVLLNRVNDTHKRFGLSLIDVVLKPHQFSSFSAGDPNAVKLPNPQFPSDYASWPKIMDVVTDSLATDPTNGATHYESCDSQHVPQWATTDKMTVKIGPFRFYRL